MWYQLGTPNRKSILEWIINLVPAKAIISCGPEGQIEQARFTPSRPGKLVVPGVDLAVSNNCKACHQTFRDVPLKERAASR